MSFNIQKTDFPDVYFEERSGRPLKYPFDKLNEVNQWFRVHISPKKVTSLKMARRRFEIKNQGVKIDVKRIGPTAYGVIRIK